MKPDFQGYASMAGLRCSDGTRILAHAFKDKDGTHVPLMWQHLHNDPAMVIGKALIEDRPEGTYVYGYLNQGPKAHDARVALEAGDVDSMSIYADRLIKHGDDIVHGVLHEVSLVLSGANPGARIDSVSIQHSDGRYMDSLTEAIITAGMTLEHSAETKEGVAMADSAGETKTLADVYDNLDEDEKKLVQYLVQKASEGSTTDADEDEDVEDAIEQSATDSDDTNDSQEDSQEDVEETDSTEDTPEVDSDEDEKIEHSNLTSQENAMTTHTVFDQNALGNTSAPKGSVLTHSQISEIVDYAKKHQTRLSESFIKHADTYGIKDIEILFPDAKAVSTTPEFLSRRMDWVNEILTKTRHLPYAAVKTIAADITADNARARGYVTGNLKKEEVFGLLARVTTPTTIYKKQKLDRDDELDITDIDVIVFLKTEMRLLLDEELARAILLGDGRPVDSEDKVKDPYTTTEGKGIRSIANDNSIYAHQVQLAAGTSVETRVDELVRARSFCRGTGQPTFFTTLPFLTDILLSKNKIGDRIYKNTDDIATVLMVSKITDVEPMEDFADMVGIFVNPIDYAIGTDAGGQTTFFEDFDIDYNQKKFLLELRASGALIKLKSAVVVRRALGTLVTPTSPSFDGATNTLTIPSITGVQYTIDDEVVTGEEVITEDVEVIATPTTGYDFPVGASTHWSFGYTEI